MSITILVSAAEKYEQPIDVAAFELQSINLHKGLTREQMSKLLELLQPVLEAGRLADYDMLRLTYIIGGVPKLEQRWAPGAAGMSTSDDWVPLRPGYRLWLDLSLVPELPVFTL